MPAYANSSGNSGVVAFDDADPDEIRVRFRSGRHLTYVYTRLSVGAANLARMKRLANAGAGLNSFINRHVRYNYALRF
jgi:hypothetical protein